MHKYGERERERQRQRQSGWGGVLGTYLKGLAFVSVDFSPPLCVIFLKYMS